MRLEGKFMLFATALAAAAASGAAAAAQGLWSERAGLGLKPSRDAAVIWMIGDGLRWEGWRSSFETAVAQESSIAPRRYSLSGRVDAPLSAGRGLSVGLQYRMYEPGGALPLALAGDPGWTAGIQPYGLGRVPGAGLGPSYQLQLSYQYSAASTFGLALGRELETFTPGFDVPGNGTRQLTFTGQHWLTPSWALSYDVLSSDPANPFRLQGLGLRLGVRYRF